MIIPNSCIVWEGISLLDNKTPIVAIATGFQKTENRKLGEETIVIHVIRQDILPSAAVWQKLDSAVCGDCPLSGGNGCYVITGFSTNSIFNCYKKGGYSKITPDHLDHLRRHQKVLRLTGYGDIVAIPKDAIAPLIEVAATTLGYTHQWKLEIAKNYQGEIMASVESEADAILAQSQGWKTFRIKSAADPCLTGEIHCPNQVNKDTQCQNCRSCDGKTQNIVINAHGSVMRLKRINQVLTKNRSKF